MASANTETLTIRLPVSTVQQFRQIAQENGTNRNSLGKDLIAEFVKSHQAKTL